MMSNTIVANWSLLDFVVYVFAGFGVVVFVVAVVAFAWGALEDFIDERVSTEINKLDYASSDYVSKRFQNMWDKVDEHGQRLVNLEKPKVKPSR